jgi:Fe-S-cluster-containing hydrogenase component 2
MQREVGPAVAGHAAPQLGNLPPVTRRSAAPVAKVNEDACVLCGACAAACPTEAISLGDTAAEIHIDRCCGCGTCVDVCPRGAIELT